MTESASKIALLATGFGPFLSHSYNPSWEVARVFSESLGEGYACEARRLDVSFELARGFAEDICFGGVSGEPSAQVDAPDWLVHFGLAASSKEVKFEEFGYNRRGETSDSDDPGARLDLNGVLAADGRESYRSGVDVARLVELFERSEEARACGLKACVSRDPGDYVCNAIYYHSLRAAEKVRARGGRVGVLFVHVPALEPAQAGLLGGAVAACFRRYLGERRAQG